MIKRYQSLYAVLLSCAVALHASAQGTGSAMLGGAHISSDVINMLFTRSIEEDVPVRERVGRGMTMGNSHTEGEVTVDFVPNAQRAEMRIKFNGDIRINNALSYQGPVRVRASVNNHVQAAKTVTMDRSGVSSRPTHVNCRTNMKIRDVSADRPLIERIGRRRAHRLHGETEQEVRARTRRQFANRLDERVDSGLGRSDGRFSKLLAPGDDGQTALGPNVSFRSSTTHAQMWIANKSDSSVPEVLTSIRLNPNYDVHVIWHESIVSNFLEKRVGGRRCKDERVSRVIKHFCGSEPPALWIHARRPRWSFVVAEERPVDLQFQDNNVHVTVNITELQNGEDVYAAPIQVKISVRPELTRDGPCLIRTAGPAVTIGEQQLTGEQCDFATKFLTAKFGAMLPECMYFDGIGLPEGKAWDPLRSLEPIRIVPKNGLFEFAMRFAEQKVASKDEGESGQAY